jgi:hypothetical protein
MRVGEFEAHVTVRCDGGDAQVGRLERWAAARGWKCAHIVLARGRVPSQPMVTLGGCGPYEEQVRICRAAADDLRAAGFVPVRVKIEVPPWDPAVPRSDEEARAWALRCGPGTAADGTAPRYFEHHVKVLLDAGTGLGPGPGAAARDGQRSPGVSPLATLIAVAVAHDAHVSWNARRVAGPAGREQRFVTQRCHGVGLPTARGRLAALRRALADLGVHIAEAEQEFVVYDSDTAVDEGWIVAARREEVAGR